MTVNKVLQAEFKKKSLAETAKTVRNLKYEDYDISSIGTNAGYV